MYQFKMHFSVCTYRCDGTGCMTPCFQASGHYAVYFQIFNVILPRGYFYVMYMFLLAFSSL